jgi:chemotaxis protein CheX
MNSLQPSAGETVVLDAMLDLKAADRLKAELMERRGLPLEIDASGVQRLGGLCLQVLIAAHNAWRLDGASMTISPQSPEFTEALQLFGADALFPIQ